LAWLIALTRITSRLSVNTRMNLFCRLLQATSVVAFLTPDVSHAANLYVKRACALYGCPTVITIGGMISPGDAETFDQLTSANDTKYAVNLDTEGGSILEAQKIAHRIHQLGPIMITSISDGKVCESACVLLFFATDRRFAHSSAVVGLHRAWRPRNGGGYDDAPDGVAMMAKELARDGVSEAQAHGRDAGRVDVLSSGRCARARGRHRRRRARSSRRGEYVAGDREWFTD
jgi:hypothetical protein